MTEEKREFTGDCDGCFILCSEWAADWLTMEKNCAENRDSGLVRTEPDVNERPW